MTTFVKTSQFFTVAFLFFRHFCLYSLQVGRHFYPLSSSEFFGVSTLSTGGVVTGFSSGLGQQSNLVILLTLKSSPYFSFRPK